MDLLELIWVDIRYILPNEIFSKIHINYIYVKEIIFKKQA